MLVLELKYIKWSVKLPYVVPGKPPNKCILFLPLE